MRNINLFSAVIGFAYATDESDETDAFDTLSFTFGLWEHADVDNKSYWNNLTEVLPTDGEWATEPTYEEVTDEICTSRVPINQCAWRETNYRIFTYGYEEDSDYCQLVPDDPSCSRSD